LGSPPRAGDAPDLVLPRAALELERHEAAPLRALQFHRVMPAVGEREAEKEQRRDVGERNEEGR
jgi:hypothetical protein